MTQASWRDVLPVHPAAELFPMMSEAELRELGEDIKKNGLRQHCAVIEVAESKYELGGKPVALLDGHNRLDTIEIVGGKLEDYGDCECGGTRWLVVAPGTDPYDYVIGANIHRRHLTAEDQRRLIEAVLKARPELSDRQVAKKLKRDHKTIGKVRKKMEDVGTIPRVETRTDTKGRKQPAKRKPAAQELFDSPQEAHGTIWAKRASIRRSAIQLSHRIASKASGRTNYAELR